jgi:hypothetical protein
MKLIIFATGLAFGLAFVPASSRATNMSFEQARDSIIGVCAGSHRTPGSCNVCINGQVRRLVGDNLVTRREGAKVGASFRRECSNRCVRTTCFVEGRACGTHSDGCGGTMSCGPSCGTGGPNLQICACADGTQVDMCTTVNCDSGPEQDAVCGPACAANGGPVATGCIFAEPVCSQ